MKKQEDTICTLGCILGPGVGIDDGIRGWGRRVPFFFSFMSTMSTCQHVTLHILHPPLSPFPSLSIGKAISIAPFLFLSLFPLLLSLLSVRLFIRPRYGSFHFLFLPSPPLPPHTHAHTRPTSNIVHARMHAQKYTMHPNLCHAILTPHSLSRTHFGVAKGAKQTKPCKTLTGGLIETVRSFHQHCASTTERQQLCPL